VHGDHQRYMGVYMNPYPGYYFTGDGCRRDQDGFYWITGRVDDVLNVSGHRIGTAEVESALVSHIDVSEAAVVGFPDPVKGQAMCCYVTLVESAEESDELLSELKMEVRRHIGPFATPDIIVITPSLCKTRSGKIMRRILRKVSGHLHTLRLPQLLAYDCIPFIRLLRGSLRVSGIHQLLLIPAW
jgi:acetyl-CoA synthetase